MDETHEFESLKWSAPSRIYTKLNPRFYSTIGVVVLAVCLLLFVAGQFALIAAVLAVLFATYVLTNVPPEKIHNEITSKGVSFAGKIYLWDELRSFGFKHKAGYTMLLVNTKAPFPCQLILIVEGVDLGEIQKLLAKHLPFEEKLGEKDFTEKLMHQASQLLALDK